jgi:hypothetical protein
MSPATAAALEAAAPLLSGLWVPRPCQKQQQRLQEPLLLSSLSSRFHGHVTNSSSGIESRCCFSGLWVLRRRHQRQQRLLKPLLLSSLGSGLQSHVTNNSSGCKSRCRYPLWAPLSTTSTRGRAVGDGKGGEQRRNVRETAPPAERYVDTKSPHHPSSPHKVHVHVN